MFLLSFLYLFSDKYLKKYDLIGFLKNSCYVLYYLKSLNSYFVLHHVHKIFSIYIISYVSIITVLTIQDAKSRKEIFCLSVCVSPIPM